jgi:FlaA1/EpsC-like NDP-sugar epimerase
MTIPEASQLVIQAGAMGVGGEIFVLDMGEPVRIVDLAKDLIHLSGFQVGDDLEIEFVGCRPGEKLFEELHVKGETHLPTSHPKILVAEGEFAVLADISRKVDALGRLANGPVSGLRALLREVVPQYCPMGEADEARERQAA